MKTLPNGVIAYYPKLIRKIIAVLTCVGGVALASPLYEGKNIGLWVMVFVLLGTGAFWIWDSFFKAVFLIYPEKLEWYSRSFIFYTKNILLWEEITGFYLKEEFVRRGRSSTLENVLVLQTPKNSKKSVKIKNFSYSLSKTDQKSLLNELRAHGIQQRLDKKD